MTFPWTICIKVWPLWSKLTTFCRIIWRALKISSAQMIQLLQISLGEILWRFSSIHCSRETLACFVSRAWSLWVLYAAYSARKESSSVHSRNKSVWLALLRCLIKRYCHLSNRTYLPLSHSWWETHNLRSSNMLVWLSVPPLECFSPI